jgi:Ras homolog gene family, member A
MMNFSLIFLASCLFDQTYRSTKLETSMAHIEVSGKRVELILWDTGGDYNISSIRLNCYADSHVVLICFAIDSPDSLDNAEELVRMAEYFRND